jgi:hypothetical protein
MIPYGDVKPLWKSTRESLISKKKKIQTKTQLLGYLYRKKKTLIMFKFIREETESPAK